MSKGPQLKIKEMHFIYVLLLSRCATGNRRVELMNLHHTHTHTCKAGHACRVGKLQLRVNLESNVTSLSFKVCLLNIYMLFVW